MSDASWRQVDRIFHDVLEREIHERAPYLDRVCADDLALRNEVESLLGSYEEAGSFMEIPPSDSADELHGVRGSTSLAGRIFGRYELKSLLGSGGMGDVYRARDSQLKRDVAIKVLPDEFSRDAERVARFQREAEILASLSHSNIAAIYDFETLGKSRCLVLELVEGETLAERLTRGPIKMDDALRLAKQIVEALEAAHEKGIIHRDLKPANIKITHDGTVKVLDFGLAKVREGAGAASAIATNSPSVMDTTPGTIMGTMAYMSPEQARGKGVDKRSDIWAFGCVFYEMLTGHAPFARDSAPDTLAAILERDPEWSALPATTPASIQRMLVRCLDKDLRNRQHDIADVRIELEDVLNGSAPVLMETEGSEQPHAPAGLRWSIAAPVSLVALLAVGVLTWQVLQTPKAKPEAQPLRTPILMLGSPAVRADGGLRSVAITPNGTHLLYISSTNAVFDRTLNGLEPRMLVNGAAPLNYVFADDQWVGYVEGTQIRKAPIAGGPPITILTSGSPSAGAAWAPEDTIIFADEDPKAGLQRVSVHGGNVTMLTHPDSTHGERDHIWPEMLPGGKAVLLTVTFETGRPADSQLAVLDLATNRPKILVGGSHARYLPSGYLIYTSGGKFQAIGFDPVGLKTIGMSFTVGAVQIRRPLVDEAGDFDVAADGTLAYVDAPAPGNSTQDIQLERSLVWVNREGKEETLGAPADRYLHARLSPDGTRVAVATGGVNGNIRIWALSLRSFITQMTSTPSVEQSPIWLDGINLAFHYPSANPKPTLFRQNVDGRSAAVELANGPPSGVTPDHKTLLYSPGGKALWRLPLENPSHAEVLLDDPSSAERNGVVSPDFRWLAYESDKEKAGEFEIYLAEYSRAGARQWRISSGGGTMPLWNPISRPNNLELFYAAPDGAIKSVGIGPGGMRLGDATTVIEAGPYVTSAGAAPRTYDVSLDGKRFLMVKKSPAERSALPPQIILVKNWLGELKRLAPTKPF